MLRPPDVCIVYQKIGIYMVHMGDNDMHGAHAGKKKKVTSILSHNKNTSLEFSSGRKFLVYTSLFLFPNLLIYIPL